MATNAPFPPEALSEILGIPLGKLLQVDEYDSVSRRVRDLFGEQECGRLFNVGWGGLGYRSRACLDHNDTFQQLFKREPGASHEERYLQDHHFFGCVTNACSAAEGLVFAAHALAAGFSGSQLSPNILRRTRDAMVAHISTVKRTAQLSQHLSSALRAPESIALFEMRDVLLHRGRLPRNHFVGGEFHAKMTLPLNPKKTPNDWVNRFVFSPDCTRDWLTWLQELTTSSTSMLLVILDSEGAK